MALTGSLNDISIADLIQLNCQSGVQARLTAHSAGDELVVYFDGGQIVHAQVRDVVGAEAVYALLAWQTGTFQVEQGQAAPRRTIELPWSALVMEGLRRLDEGHLAAPAPPPLDRLALTVRDMLASSAFQGMLVIGRDGRVLAAELPPKLDPARVAAVAAGTLSLSGRSVQQLARGELQQTVIQGAAGNILLVHAGKNAALLALADTHVNLGLAFLEARESAQKVAAVLGQVAEFK